MKTHTEAIDPFLGRCGMPGNLRPGEGERASGVGVVTPTEGPLDTQPPTLAGAAKVSSDTGGGARP